MHIMCLYAENAFWLKYNYTELITSIVRSHSDWNLTPLGVVCEPSSPEAGQNQAKFHEVQKFLIERNSAGTAIIYETSCNECQMSTVLWLSE
jgi:hypothetical protein